MGEIEHILVERKWREELKETFCFYLIIIALAWYRYVFPLSLHHCVN